MWWDDVSATWVRLASETQWSERWIFVVGIWLSSFITFWGINGALLLCYRNKVLWKYQIQPNSKPEEELVWENIRETLLNQAVGIPLTAYFLFDVFKYFGMKVIAPLPPMSIVARDLVVALVFCDFFGYWAHRTLHHKALYKHFHKHHHRYKVTIGIASVFAHPVEDMINNTFSTISGCLLMGSHYLVLILWLIIRLSEAVGSHSGYHITPRWISRWFSSGRFHEFHHSHNVGNFGAFTTIWDQLFGTDIAFNEHEEKRLRNGGKVH